MPSRPEAEFVLQYFKRSATSFTVGGSTSEEESPRSGSRYYEMGFVLKAISF